ncbi:MAG: glycosyltransferase, partial [Methylocystis sp.]
EEIVTLPFISLRPELPGRTGHVPASPPIVAFVGHLGDRKGLALIPGLIRELERRNVKVRWTIAGECFQPESSAFSEIESLAGSHCNVSLAIGPSGLDDYVRQLTSADILLLPYCPDTYEERGSGISEEAETMGVPYIAPKVAFSSRAVAAGSAIAFERWSVEGIAEAITAALNDLEMMTRAAEERSNKIKQQIKRTRDGILLSLLEWPSLKESVQPAYIAQFPGIDIIITLYNYKNYLIDSLESVRRQKYPNWRCIVVDDCSTDASFDELKAIVAGFGDKFYYERHSSSGGQLSAIATGLSLGLNPFVMLLDADDCLMENAIDVHLSWHLNKRVPVALTSGRVQLVDELGRLLAGSMDNIIFTDHECHFSPLVPDDAYCRPDSDLDVSSAVFIRPTNSNIGKWFWAPTSGLMFRRSTMELVLPDRLNLGRYSGDTFFALTCHAIGGSILIDKPVALYRRHGSNGYSDMAIYGAGTQSIRNGSCTPDDVKDVLLAHLSENYVDVARQINHFHIDQILALKEPPIQALSSDAETCEEVAQELSSDAETFEEVAPTRARMPWIKPVAEFSCTMGRALRARWLVEVGERLWQW